MAKARPSKTRKLTHESNPFIDDEAVVDRDDEEVEEEGFIEDELGEDIDDVEVYAQVNATLRAKDNEAETRPGVGADGEKEITSQLDVAFADTQLPLETDSPAWRAGTWARFRGPKLYRGDIGFIFSRKNKTIGHFALWIALVPRIDIHNTMTTRSVRPPAQTLNVNDIMRDFDMNVDFGKDFYFLRKTFNYSGYLILPLDAADLYPANSFAPVPLLEEFDKFLRLPALNRTKWADHRLTIWQHNSTANDRVKLQAGPYQGMVGVLLAKTDLEAEVYIPAKDEVAVVVVTDLQIDLQNGDYVRVVNAGHSGRTGYITSLDSEWVIVSNPQDEFEARVLALDVEFYTAPTMIMVKSHSFEVGDEIIATTGPHASKVGLVRAINDGWLVVTTGSDIEPIDILYRDAKHTTSPKTNKICELMNKSQIDMYSLYKGCYCLITRGPYKAHRGLVKVTHPDGRLGVQLDTNLSQIIHFKFDEVLAQELAMALPPPVSAFTLEPPAVVPEHRPITILFPDVVVEGTPTWSVQRTSAAVASTPAEPEPLRSDHSSFTLPVPTWLLSGEFVPHRIRLVDITNDGPHLQYYMPAENGEGVIVMTCGKMRTIPVENLRHIMPEAAYDLVVPLDGEFRGKLMKVKEFRQDECSLTVFGAKRIRQKGYQFPRCQTRALAFTNPPRESTY